MTPAATEAWVPPLRFPGFTAPWEEKRLGDVARFAKGKGVSKADLVEGGRTPCIRYAELYTTYGSVITDVVSRTNASPSELTLSKGGEVIIPASGETAEDIATASVIVPSGVALGGDLNILTTSEDGAFLARYLSSKLKRRIASAAQGNAIVHLYQGQLAATVANLPNLDEQQKIAGFLGGVDRWVAGLRARRDALADYKRGVMQRLFSRQLRFTRPDGTPFPDWQEKRLGEVLIDHAEKSAGAEPVFSVAVRAGLINQIEHLGRSFAAENTSHYAKVKPHDVVYTKSPTGDFPFGIIKQSHVTFDVIVSPLYGVFTPETPALGYILHTYFEAPAATNNFLKPLVQKGAKNTINVTNPAFLAGRLRLPVDRDEQRKIAGFLGALDRRIDAVTAQITTAEAFKHGLLQQMFV